MTQFTANEVRACKKVLASVSGTGTAQEMLNAFADLLETREKAVPVATIQLPDPEAGFDEIGPWWDMRDLDRLRLLPAGTNLYTHPAPSDAERLAEALERTARHRAAADRINPDQWRSVLYSWEDRALAAHSAQAQPPAASVTDAMVEDGCVAWNKSAGLGYAVADRDCMRAAIEAALAAQENPMADMTLEQVRDWLLARAKDGQMQRSVYASNYQLREMADAIDAAIKQREQDKGGCRS